MSKFPFLFQTGSMGRMQLRNRIIMAPLGANLADASGAVTRQLIDWYAAAGLGGSRPGDCREQHGGYPFWPEGLAHQLRFDDPKLTPGLNELVEAVQASGTKIAIQINI